MPCSPVLRIGPRRAAQNRQPQHHLERSYFQNSMHIIHAIFPQPHACWKSVRMFCNDRKRAFPNLAASKWPVSVGIKLWFIEPNPIDGVCTDGGHLLPCETLISGAT